MLGGNEGARTTLWEVEMGRLVRFIDPMGGGNEGTREVYKPYGRWV